MANPIKEGDLKPGPSGRDYGHSLDEGESASTDAIATLVDARWYNEAYPDVAASAMPPLTHYRRHGWREGRWPNLYFDPVWYRSAYPQVAADLDPLLHYVLVGEASDFQPAEYFDTAWYRRQHNPAPVETSLAHYLRHRHSGRVSPLPEFDPAWYCATYEDVRAAGIDPFEHYLLTGFREGRDPSSRFNTRYYRSRHLADQPDRNPLLHARATPANGAARVEESVFSEVRRFAAAGPAFEPTRPLPPGHAPRVRVLAFYLPQFHPIPENDAWWGKGFTEWTAISRGMPRFEGHYQPRIPGDLGHYSLAGTAGVETMRRQIDLARGGGVGGFVFYYYRFQKLRLLEAPLESWLAAPDLDFPFCLMWANENWTRRWDGLESEVLVAQSYNREDEAALIDDLARHFRDPRYLRLQGRPLLQVYRADTIPDPLVTLARWRGLFGERHGEHPVLMMAQSFGCADPRPFGFDAAVEFPPHKLADKIEPLNHALTIYDPNLRASVYEYDTVVAASLEQPAPDFPLIRTALPGWDNDARRQGAGLTLRGATPAKYQAWLAALADLASDAPFMGEPLVCVNAWNEWAEGAYLEPDVHFGAAFLNATARAVAPFADAWNGKLLLVGHDAFAAGAQYLTLHVLKTLRRRFGAAAEMVLLGGGTLEPEFRQAGPLTIAADPVSFQAAVAAAVGRGVAHAIVNSAAAAWTVPALRDAGLSVTLLIHELPGILRERSLFAPAAAAARAARKVVFASEMVAQQFEREVGLPTGRKAILPQGAYARPAVDDVARARQRAALGLGEATWMVLCVGYADLRKGFDLFLQAWRASRRARADALFCWVGDLDPALEPFLGPEIARAEAEGGFLRLDHQHPVDSFYAAADIFVLTSREDPYPSVVLEALESGLPVVAFEGATGMAPLIEAHGGALAPMADAVALAEAALALRGAARAQRAYRTAALFPFADYVAKLLDLAVPDRASVSVVVPSFDYARYLPERLNSIFAQTHPVNEVILLDDGSTDDSVAVARETAAGCGREITIRDSATNSGSAFLPWIAAASLVESEFVWIAEADDLAEPAFLATLIERMRHSPDIQIAFCDSCAIDADGAELWPSHKDYYRTHGAVELLQDQILSFADFVQRFLAARNLILNVSAVLWRRDALRAALARCESDLRQARSAGDWRLYIELMTGREGRVAYIATPLNRHRRHGASVTGRTPSAVASKEAIRMHDLINDRCKPNPLVRDAQRILVSELRSLTPPHRKSARGDPKVVRRPRASRRR